MGKPENLAGRLAEDLWGSWWLKVGGSDRPYTVPPSNHRVLRPTTVGTFLEGNWVASIGIFKNVNWAEWDTPVIPALWVAKAGRLQV